MRRARTVSGVAHALSSHATDLSARQRGNAMRILIGCTRLLLLVVGAASSGSSLAGVEEGVAALLKADYATALKEFQPLAERGDAEAQYRLGRMYEFGRGVLANMALAMSWLNKSAAQGNASAETELGAIYASGFGGVPQ